MNALNEPMLQEGGVFEDGRRRRANGIGKAAWLLEDALAENLVEDYPRDQEARKLFFRCAQANKRYVRCITVMFFLSMIETPTWCTPLWNQPANHKGPDFPVKGFWTYEANLCVDSMDANFEDWYDKFGGDKSARREEEREHALSFMFSGVPYIPPGWGLVIETVLLLIMWQKLSLDRKLQSTYFDKLSQPGEEPVKYYNMTVVKVCQFMVLVEVVDMAVFFAFRNPFRVIWITRFVFMICIPSVLFLLIAIQGIVIQFTTIAVFFLGGLCLSAWICTMLLQDMGRSEDNDYQYVFINYTEWVNRSAYPNTNLGQSEFEDDFEKKEEYVVNNGFTNAVVSFVSMFIAGATDDFYEKFRNTYSKRRAYGLIWFAFLTIVHVLLLSLVLDTLVSAYTKHNEEQEEKGIKGKAKGMFLSFKELTNTCADVAKEKAGLNGRIIKEKEFIDFALEYGKSPNNMPLNKEQAECLFKAVARKPKCAKIDDDGERGLLLRGFVSVCGLMKFNIWFTIKDSPVKEQFPSLWNSGWFQKLYDWTQEPKDGESPLNKVMNMVLGVNLILVVIEAAFELQKNEDDKEAAWGLPSLELMFSFIYLLEVGIKLCVWSWDEYTSNKSNIFDFLATILLLGSSGASIIQDMFFDDQNSVKNKASGAKGVKKAMNMLRLLRLVRVVKQLKQFPAVQFMMGTIAKLVSQAQSILALLLIFVYFFSALGVQFFGGFLWRGREALEETEWNEEKYFVLNFNDFLNSFGCWVVLLLTEYKHGFTQAIMQVGPPGSFIVFPLFYILSVSIIFELVKAYTIEVFVDMHKENNAEKKEFSSKKQGRAKARDRLSITLERKKEKKKGLFGGFCDACKGEDAESELKKECELLKHKMNTHVSEEVKTLLENQIQQIEEMQEEKADPLDELKEEFEEEQGKKLHTAVDAESKEMQEILQELQAVEFVGRQVWLKKGGEKKEGVVILDYDVHEEKKKTHEEGGEEEEEEEEEPIFVWLVQLSSGHKEWVLPDELDPPPKHEEHHKE